MSKFKVSLHFDDEAGSLSKENGIPLGFFAELLKELANVTGKKGIVLSNISNNSYGPELSTSSEIQYHSVLSLHRDLAEKSLVDLSRKEGKYASVLRKVLSQKINGKSIFVDIRDTNDAKVIRLYKDDINREVDHYFSVKTIVGIMSLTGSASIEEKTHIRIHGLPYIVFTSDQQDKELMQFYRQSPLSFRVRQKISTNTGKILSAVLLSFTPKTTNKFPDSLSNIIDALTKMNFNAS